MSRFGDQPRLLTEDEFVNLGYMKDVGRMRPFLSALNACGVFMADYDYLVGGDGGALNPHTTICGPKDAPYPGVLIEEKTKNGWGRKFSRNSFGVMSHSANVLGVAGLAVWHNMEESFLTSLPHRSGDRDGMLRSVYRALTSAVVRYYAYPLNGLGRASMNESHVVPGEVFGTAELADVLRECVSRAPVACRADWGEWDGIPASLRSGGV